MDALAVASRPEPAPLPAPFHVSWQKLMMWIFLVGDAILFAAFLASYGFIRLSSPAWPDMGSVLNLNFVALMTFTLITSSATMATAVGAARAGDARKVRGFLLLTALGGAAFLGMQAYEWSHLITQGASPVSNPWGVPAFSAFFFMITGFHGSHVLLGVVILTITALKGRWRGSGGESVELVGLYWHFVDLVWVFIFGCFYLI